MKNETPNSQNMKIALIGYGKMGRAIEEISQERGHQIVLRTNRSGYRAEDLAVADVAIEFTSPESAFENITRCLDAGVPIVSGSTGWLEKWPQVIKKTQDKEGTLFYASNFSLGVNLFFELNKKLAQLMDAHPQYDVKMEEIHHTQKKDAPSGTAISLAEQIIEWVTRKNDWHLGSNAAPNEIAIVAKRIDPAPGTHIITYTSEIDDIEITHTAHSRKGFALGAVLAAEFSVKNKGVLSMADLLKL